MAGIVYLHAGDMKTGTSAIQVALVRHRDWLLKQGVWYPLSRSDQMAEQGMITSGNGPLLTFLWRSDLSAEQRSQQIAGIEKVLSERPRHNILYSSEFISKASLDALKDLRTLVARRKRQLKFVYYVRHLLDAAVSLYLQSVQSGQTTEFPIWIKSFRHRYMVVIEKLFEVVGEENVIVKLYDADKTNLFDSFVKTIGISNGTGPIGGTASRVNRSLTADEVDILLPLNRHLLHALGREHARRVAKDVAERIIYGEPYGSEKLAVSQVEFDQFAQNNADVLERLNKVLDPSSPVQMKSETQQIGDRVSDRSHDARRVLSCILEELLDHLIVPRPEQSQLEPDSSERKAHNLTLSNLAEL